jgi:hypothetical protein
MLDPYGKTDARSLMVFSHPNHELAIFGSIQHLRPNMIMLTDGGPPERVAQSKEGLVSLGLLENATFLNWTEPEFYNALLEKDVALYQRVVDKVASEIEALNPDQIFCDAVEFYNPVHDMALPIVKAALEKCGQTDTPVFEVPLVFQLPTGEEEYSFQRFPDAFAAEVIEYNLAPEEFRRKTAARDGVYHLLREQLKPFLGSTAAEHFSREVVRPAPVSIPEPGAERKLRYEWRAELLKAQGEIDRMITHAGHFIPMVASLIPRG